MLQDHAMCHTSKMTMAYLRKRGVRTIKWPGNSPDLNPIENVFGLIKSQLKLYDCSNRKKVIRNLRHIWRELGQDYFRSLARSMPRRIAACIANNYGSTKY